MALRLVAKKILSQQAPRLSVRAFGVAAAEPPAVAPTVFDKLITLTIVDPSGARRKIPAMAGTLSLSRLFFFFVVQCIL